MVHKAMTKLTIFTDPCDIDPRPANHVTTRKFDRVDEFAAAVGATAAIEVTVIEEYLTQAPDDGFIAIFWNPGTHDLLTHHPALCPRIVLLRPYREDVREIIKTFGVAAAIEDERYYHWYSRQDQETGEGLYGRKDVAGLMGAVVKSGLYSTEHYGLLAHPQCRDLPELLAAYLCTLTSID